MAEPGPSPDAPAAAATVAPVRGMTVSTLLAGSGLLVLGISASVYLVVTARMVGAVAFSEIAVLWTLVYTFGIGLFLPFEQELARAASIRLARRLGLGHLVGRAAISAVVLFLALLPVLGVLMAIPSTRRALFDSSGWYLLALLVAVGGLGVQYLQRGVFSATGRFSWYGGQQGTEGVLRTLACAGLAVGGVHQPLAYAYVLAVCPWLAAAVVWGAFRVPLREPGPPAEWAELRGRLGWLLCATLGSQALANLAAPAVRMMSSPDEQAAAGNFLSGLTIARIPLLLFAAVQAVLLPRLVRHHDSGDLDGYRAQLRTVLAATAAIGAAGIVGVALVGPLVLRVLFGAAFDLPRADLVWLALSAALLMLGLAMQSAVVALDDHRGSGLAWASGVAVFLAALFLPGSIFLRAELALVLGSIAVLALLWLRVRRGLRSETAMPATRRNRPS